MFTADPDGEVGRLRLQLYVDDPAVVASGTEQERQRALDCLVCYWLALGLPLAWKKGSVHDGTEKHSWIGVTFTLEVPGRTIVAATDEFRADLLKIVSRFCSTSGHECSKLAEQMCGKVARLAQIVPAVQPFSTALYGAFYAALKAEAAGAHEAPPRRVAVTRFRQTCKWLRALLEDSSEHFELRSFIGVPRHAPHPSELRIEFDASVWGAGAILYEDDQPSEFMAVPWKREEMWPGCQLKLDGSPGEMTVLEYLAFQPLWFQKITGSEKFPFSPKTLACRFPF